MRKWGLLRDGVEPKDGLRWPMPSSARGVNGARAARTVVPLGEDS